MQTPTKRTTIGVIRQMSFAVSMFCALVTPLFAQGNNWQIQCNKLFTQGAELERQGDYTNAGFSYTECRGLAKLHKMPQTEASALHRLAVLKARSKKFSESAELFRSAIALDKKNATILCDFAQLYADRRMYDDAETILKNALLLEPNNTQVLVSLGMTVAQQRDREAEGCRYLKLALGEAQGYKELAKIYRTKGNIGQAEFAEQKAALAATNPSLSEILTTNGTPSVTSLPVPQKAAVPSIPSDSKPPVPVLPATPTAVVQHAKEDLLRLETKEIALEQAKQASLAGINDRQYKQDKNIVARAAESAVNSVTVTKSAPPLTDPFSIVPIPAPSRTQTDAVSAAMPYEASVQFAQPLATIAEPVNVNIARKNVNTSEPLMFIKPQNSGVSDSSQLIKIATEPTRKNATDVIKDTSEPSLQKIPNTTKRPQALQVTPNFNNVAHIADTASAIADTNTPLRRTPVTGSGVSETKPKVAIIGSLPEFKPLGVKTLPETSAVAKSQPVCNEPERNANSNADYRSKAEFVLNNHQGIPSPNSQPNLTLSQPLKLIVRDSAPAQTTDIQRVPPPYTEFAEVDGQKLLQDALDNAGRESVMVADNARHTIQGDLPKYTPISERPATEYQFSSSTAPNVRSFGLAEKLPEPSISHLDTAPSNNQVLPPQVLNFAVPEQNNNYVFAAHDPLETAPVEMPAPSPNESLGDPFLAHQVTTSLVPAVAPNITVRNSDEKFSSIMKDTREEKTSSVRFSEVVKTEEVKPVLAVVPNVTRNAENSSVRFSEVAKAEEVKPVPAVVPNVTRSSDDMIQPINGSNTAATELRNLKYPSTRTIEVAKTEYAKPAPVAVPNVTRNLDDIVQPIRGDNAASTELRSVESISPSVRLSDILGDEEHKSAIPESVKIVKNSEQAAGFASSRARKPAMTEVATEQPEAPAGFASSRKK